MSQVEMAAAVGVSQATISRFEKGENALSIQVLAKVARLFGCHLRDLIPADRIQELLAVIDDHEFYAFCPNPFCENNTVEMQDDRLLVRWKSGRSYPTDRFQETNFCPTCGTDLTKECPSCGRHLERPARYCIACGTKLTERPTDREWEQIKELNDPKIKSSVPLSSDEFDDDIPF